METVAESPVDKPNNHQRIKKRINYALAATLLASGANREAVAKECGAKNWNVLKVGLSKKGVFASATRALPPSQIVVQQSAVKIAAAAADEIRDRLNRELMGQVDSLSTKSVRYSDLASKGQGRAAMVKTIAESFRALNGGAEMNVLVFGVGSMESSPGDRQPVIDVEQVNPEQEKQGE